MAGPDDQAARHRALGRIWPKLLLSGLVGLTVAVGIALKLLLG